MQDVTSRRFDVTEGAPFLPMAPFFFFFIALPTGGEATGQDCVKKILSSPVALDDNTYLPFGSGAGLGRWRRCC